MRLLEKLSLHCFRTLISPYASTYKSCHILPGRMPARGDMEATDIRARAIRRGGPKRMSTDFYLHATASDTVTSDAGHPIKTE